jgi:hypothetical protein
VSPRRQKYNSYKPSKRSAEEGRGQALHSPNKDSSGGLEAAQSPIYNQPEGYQVNLYAVSPPAAKRCLFSPGGGKHSVLDQARKVGELLQERPEATNKNPSSIKLGRSNQSSPVDSQVLAAEWKASEAEELRKWKAIQAEILQRIQKAREEVEYITWKEGHQKTEEKRRLNKSNAHSQAAGPQLPARPDAEEPLVQDSNPSESGTPNWAEEGARAWAEVEEHSRAAELCQAKVDKAASVKGCAESEERNKAKADLHQKAAAAWWVQAATATAKAAARLKAPKEKGPQVIHNLQGILEESEEECVKFVPDTQVLEGAGHKLSKRGAPSPPLVTPSKKANAAAYSRVTRSNGVSYDELQHLRIERTCQEGQCANLPGNILPQD